MDIKEYLLNQLRERLNTTVKSLKDYEEFVGGPTDQIEYATRTVSRADKEELKDIRRDPEFRSTVFREVMSSMDKSEKGQDVYKEITNDRYQMLQAITYTPDAIEYASDRLKEDPMFLIEAVKLNPNLIEYNIIKQFRNENPSFNKHIERVEKEQRLATLQGQDRKLDENIRQAREELETEHTNEASRDD